MFGHFRQRPTFYASASTRPVDEIAPDGLRTLNRIRLRQLRLPPAFSQEHPLSCQDREEFRDAVARLKGKMVFSFELPLLPASPGRTCLARASGDLSTSQLGRLTRAFTCFASRSFSAN